MKGLLEEALGQDPSQVDGVHFFEVDYTPMSAGFRPFRVEAQAVVIDREEFLWLDGVDFEDPVLVPLQSLRGVRFLGSLDDLMAEYSEQIQQLAITEDLTLISPTVLLRAARCMVEDGLSSTEALQSAFTLSQMLLELDELDRRFMDSAIQKTMDAVQMYASS